MQLFMPAKHTYHTDPDSFEEAVLEQLWFDPFEYNDASERSVFDMIAFDFEHGRSVEQSASRVNNAIVVGSE